MANYVEKISAYEIFTILWPGVLVTWCILFVLGVNINLNSLTSLVIFVCLAYFMGVLISRFGALIVEPIIKKFGWVEWSDDYYLAEKNDPKITTLLKNLNMYRNLLALDVLCTSVAIYGLRGGVFGLDCFVEIVSISIALFIIFGASYSRQSKQIVKRINFVKKGNKNEKNGSL